MANVISWRRTKGNNPYGRYDKGETGIGTTTWKQTIIHTGGEEILYLDYGRNRKNARYKKEMAQYGCSLWKTLGMNTGPVKHKVHVLELVHKPL